ncbi:putative leucine-rich repeat-containing protein DDB_G0290503 [Nothobranchius furzeri]|uniref:putative leucine-rich repeat-containing protein DDB_G0290503 n=1 Tax=Nothobranchius furzeri TaxID=105023 RepID=UPI003904D331
MNRRNVSWYDSHLHPEEMDYESDMDFVSDSEGENSELLSEIEEMENDMFDENVSWYDSRLHPEEMDYESDMENDMFDETEHKSVFDAEVESLQYETKLPAEMEFPGSETVYSDSETMVPRSQMVQRELAGFKRPRKPQQPLTFGEMTNSTNMSWYDLCVNNVEVDYDLVIDFSSDGENEKSDLLSTTTEMESEMPEQTSVFDAEKESLLNETHLSAELEISGSETVVPRPQAVQQELVDFKSRQIDDLLKQVDHLKENLQNINTCFNQEEKRLAAKNQCVLYKEQTKEMENSLVQQQQKLVALEKQLQEQKNVNEDLQEICSDLKSETDESRFSGVSRDVLIENFKKLEERHLDLEAMFSREKDEKISVEQKLTDKLENLKEQLSEKDIFIKNLQTDLDQERRFRLVSVQEQKNAQHKVTVNENYKKEIKDLKKRTGYLSELLDNIKTDMKYTERILLEERNDFKHQLKQKNLICESLEKRLNKENELRLTCEEELKKTKDQMSSMNGNLKKEIKDLTQSNSELRVVVENLTAENAASHQELADQQERVKHQLQDKSVVCDLLKQVDHLKEKLQNRNTCFNQEREKRIAAENQCALYKEQTKEMENGLVQQQQKLVALEKQLQEQKNVNKDLQEICSDLQGETDESRFSGVSRNDLIENFEKLEERHLDLEAMFSREKDEKISVEQKLTDKLENLKEQLSEKNVFIENLQTDLDQERRFRLVSVQEQKTAQHKVTVNENYKKEMKDLKKRNGDLSEMLDNVKTDMKNRDRKRLEEQNNFKHQLKQKKVICESLEKRLNKENELRLTCEEELKKTKDQMSSMNGNLKKEINDLKQKNLELSQTLRSGQAVETKSEQMCEDLQKFKQLLHEKISICEELSSSLDMEKQLRVSYEAQLDSNRAIVCENSDLKEQIKDLTQSNSELRVAVENLTAENAASHQELAEQLERVKHQLQDKSFVCENLETGFTNEQKLRLQLYQQLQETSGLFLKNVCKVIVNLQLDQLRSKKQHEQELGILKEQVSELESLTTTLESQNLILRLKTERFNPDQQTETISEQNVDAAEGNKSLPAENDSLAESLESQRDAPHSDTKKQEKVSVWRHFKKFVTPGCLRQHKNKQPSN